MLKFKKINFQKYNDSLGREQQIELKKRGVLRKAFRVENF
jgi:hypothetical protein